MTFLQRSPHLPERVDSVTSTTMTLSLSNFFGVSDDSAERRPQNPSERLGKVPEITLGFWIIKIAATTLGETGGDAVTMSMNLGYLVGTAIFATIFVAAVAVQISARR